MILAHAGISDLAWLWHELPDHPNVFIDTAWWNPADLIALFALVAPSQIVWASDSPYGMPVIAAFTHGRCMLSAGLGDEAMRSIIGGQIARLVAGEDPLWVGDAPGVVEPHLHPLHGPRRHAPDLRDGPRVRRLATRRSRSRSRAWPAPSATTRRTPTSAPRCSSCSTCSASTSRRRRPAGRSRSRRGS